MALLRSYFMISMKSYKKKKKEEKTRKVRFNKIERFVKNHICKKRRKYRKGLIRWKDLSNNYLINLWACIRGFNIFKVKYMADKDKRWRMHLSIVTKKNSPISKRNTERCTRSVTNT